MATGFSELNPAYWTRITDPGKHGTCWKKTGGTVVVCQTDQETDLLLPITNINVSIDRSKRVPLDKDSKCILELKALTQNHIFYAATISDNFEKIVVDNGVHLDIIILTDSDGKILTDGADKILIKGEG